jgi:hypothetical protein
MYCMNFCEEAIGLLGSTCGVIPRFAR